MLLSSTASFLSYSAIIEPNVSCSSAYGRGVSNVCIGYILPDTKLVRSPTNAERNRIYIIKSQTGL